jgi:hypothetical protein
MRKKLIGWRLVDWRLVIYRLLSHQPESASREGLKTLLDLPVATPSNRNQPQQRDKTVPYMQNYLYIAPGMV